MGILEREVNPTEHFGADLNMCTKILLQLAVLTYIANVPSQQKYLLVEVDDNETKGLSPEISSGGMIGTFRDGEEKGKGGTKIKGKPTPKPNSAGKATGKPAAKAVPCEDVGKACLSNRECCSKDCQYPTKKAGGKGGKGGEGKDRKKRLVVDGKGTVTKSPINKDEKLGKCVKEIEKDPAPKGCAAGFKKEPFKYTDEAREKSSIIFYNYKPLECEEICRESSGCEGYLYAEDMGLYSKKDEENGCWAYYQPENAPALKRDKNLKVTKGWLACERVAGANGKGGKATAKPKGGKGGKATPKPKSRSLAMHPRDYADDKPRETKYDLCDSSCSPDPECECYYKGIPRAPPVEADCKRQMCKNSNRFECVCKRVG